MKKVLIVAVLLVPILWAGVTWFSSNKTEQVFDSMLADSNQKLTESFPFVKVEKQSFEKGFTSSTAKSTVSLNTEMFGDEKEPFIMTMNHTIYHGPVMMTPGGLKTGSSYVRTTLDQESLPAEAKEIVKLIFNGKEPLVSGMKTGVGDSVEVDLEVAPLLLDAKKIAAFSGKEVRSDDLEEISMAGITGRFTTNTEGSRLKGSLILGAMEIKGKEDGKDINMTMAESLADIDIDELYKGSMLDGSVVMKIPEFSFSDGKGVGITLNGLTMTSKAEEENGNFGGSASFDIDKLLVQSPAAPVEFPESKVHLSFAVKGFERDAVIKLVDLGQEMRSSQLALIGGSDAEEQIAEQMMKSIGTYYTAIGEAIKEGVGISNVLEISNDSGKSGVKLNINYADSKRLFDLKTVRDLVTALQGQLKINIDKSMIAGTPVEEAIGMPVAMGYAVDKGEAYEAIADLANGELKVNGESMPVLDMLGPMADQSLPWGQGKIIINSK